MIKHITLFLALFIGFSAVAQKAKRELLFMEDSAVVKSIKDYEEFSYTDTAGKTVSGKVFLKNDTQFYYLNYFNEQKGPIHHLNEIKGTYVNVNMINIGNYNSSKSGQKYFLSPGAVAAIYLLTGGLAAPILIIRELVLFYKYGQGHSLDRPTGRREKASTTITYKTNLQYKIQRLNSGS